MRESLVCGKMQSDVDRTVAVARVVASSIVPNDAGVADSGLPVRMVILEWEFQKCCEVLEVAVLIGRSLIF